MMDEITHHAHLQSHSHKRNKKKISKLYRTTTLQRVYWMEFVYNLQFWNAMHSVYFCSAPLSRHRSIWFAMYRFSSFYLIFSHQKIFCRLSFRFYLSVIALTMFVNCRIFWFENISMFDKKKWWFFISTGRKGLTITSIAMQKFVILKILRDWNMKFLIDINRFMIMPFSFDHFKNIIPSLLWIVFSAKFIFFQFFNLHKGRQSSAASLNQN